MDLYKTILKIIDYHNYNQNKNITHNKILCLLQQKATMRGVSFYIKLNI